jgi:hypothetical protein
MRAAYRASYVLSRNWGNYPGLFDADLGITTPGGNRLFFSPNQASTVPDTYRTTTPTC